jgi:competence protein ComEA
MRTELPLENLQRRLHPSTKDQDKDHLSREDQDEDDIPQVPSWVPDGNVVSPWKRALAAIRADPGRSGGIALAIVAVLAVLITIFTVMSDKPDPVVSAKLPAVEMVATNSPKPKSDQPASDQPLVVSVVGLVHQPGLVKLAAGSRVADALEAAGGALQGADTIGLNMAGRVVDGQQIVVGVTAPAGQPAALGSSVSDRPTPGSPEQSAKAPAQGPLDLNAASVEQLDALPGVGPVTAAAIVAWRDANGRFGSVDELTQVDGIGPARLEKLRALVTAG